MLSACGPHRLGVIAPMGDPATAATEVERQTGLDEPIQITFEWSLNEARQRHRGRGVARVELFTTDLELVLSAALVDGELRLPPGSRDDILPPTDLMWGALGVMRPHEARLIGGDVLEGDAKRLRYAYDDGTELRYDVVEGLLSSLELLDDGHVVQSVALSNDGLSRYPVEAKYRNLTAFRELTIVRESLERVDAFDAAIWDPSQ
jgi:hypothetical protein